MKIFLPFATLLSLVLFFGLPAIGRAVEPPALNLPSGLALAQIKVTGDEFILIHNNSQEAVADLSQYWLQNYNNVNPLAAGVGNSSQQLPIATLGPQESLLLSAVSRATCGAAVAGKLNLSLTDGSGYLQLVRMAQGSSGPYQQPGDSVSWSSGAAGHIQNVPSNSKSPQALFYRIQLVEGHGWQLAEQDSQKACQLQVGVNGSKQPVSVQTMSAAPIGASFMAAPVDGPATSPAAANPGLFAPQLTELLPNPLGTGNDATDEYIELYNPNTVAFDLTGYALQVGLGSLRQYTFPADSSLAPQSFTAFFADETGLSLSNTGSQVGLLDPQATLIGETEAYRGAKDGQAWAAAKGVWAWTLQPTPNGTNSIQAPTPKATTAKTTKKPAVKTVAQGQKEIKPAADSPGAFQEVVESRPIHTGVVALVAVAALLYGAYEYRTDLANKYQQLRRNLAARFRFWRTTSRRRGN